MDQSVPEPLIHGRGTSEAAWQGAPALHAIERVSLSELMAGRERLMVLAPHPDDEVLGCGGLMAMAALEHDVVVLSVTDGEASHPGVSAGLMRLIRARERDRALTDLGLLPHQAKRLAIADGEVTAQLTRLTELLADLTRGRDLVLAPWQGDGHPDHEATYQAAAAARKARGFVLLQYPVWGWHWCAPDQFPFHQACRLELDAAICAAKARAIGRFESQTKASDDAAILAESTLERFRRPFEVYLE